MKKKHAKTAGMIYRDVLEAWRRNNEDILEGAMRPEPACRRTGRLSRAMQGRTRPSSGISCQTPQLSCGGTAGGRPGTAAPGIRGRHSRYVCPEELVSVSLRSCAHARSASGRRFRMITESEPRDGIGVFAVPRFCGLFPSFRVAHNNSFRLFQRFSLAIRAVDGNVCPERGGVTAAQQ